MGGLGGMGGGLGGGGLGGLDLGLGGDGNMAGLGDQLPPELQKAMKQLEGLEEKLSGLSLPLLKMQYACGYKTCFGERESSGERT